MEVRPSPKALAASLIETVIGCIQACPLLNYADMLLAALAIGQPVACKKPLYVKDFIGTPSPTRLAALPTGELSKPWGWLEVNPPHS